MSAPLRVRPFAAADAASFLGTFALTFLAIAGLFAIDLFLAKIDRAESRSEARHLFQEGTRLAAQGQPFEAVDRFRGAVSTERSNPTYQRALAAALLSAGKVPEAQGVVADRLRHDPADAEASEIMAQALVREGKLPQAISYYHRAIYGQWDGEAARNRVRARFGLVDVLARQDSRQDLLAELLPLQREAPDDVATRKRIARLFVAAGSPTRAIEIYRDILRHDRDDADAYAGLGEAEFERGNYRTALADFTTAAGLKPDSPEIAAGLARSNQVLRLDPTQRGLSLDERYRRSFGLLGLILQAADSCFGPAAVDSVRTLADTARAVAKQRRPPTPTYSTVERNLDLAVRLWQARWRECPSPVPESERPLALVLDRVAQ
ncbi:MAG: tetratricopeptide repeat protein [Gemmatimonadales bacterium]